MMISLLLKATSDDESVTPGYMYKEINDISYESADYNASLVEFFADRLKSNSCHVKIKVLKLIEHLLKNGSPMFMQYIRRYSALIQECTKFGGPPDPMLGNTPYLMIRKKATEVCECLYSMMSTEVRSPPDTMLSKKPPESKYGGLGPNQSGDSIQGFGNTVTNQSKSLSETILGGLEKLSAKMAETPSTRQAALLASLDMTGSTRNYQPPTIPPSHYRESSEGEFRDSFVLAGKESSKNNVSRTKKPVSRPTPGKAGGGWGDDDDDEDGDDDDHDCEENGNESKIQSSDSQSLRQSNSDKENMADSPFSFSYPTETKDHKTEGFKSGWNQEQELLSQTLASGSTGLGGDLLAPSQISAFLHEAARLYCPILVEMLAQKLTQADQGVALRSLQLLEGMVYNDKELISIDALTSMCRDALVNCLRTNECLSRQGESDSSLKLDNIAFESTRTQSIPDPSILCSVDTKETQLRKPEASTPLSRSLYVKSAKLILTLQKLSL